MRPYTALAAAAALLVACGGREVQSPRPVRLPELVGRVHGPRERPLLAVFWATWCQPCVAEIPDLAALQTENASRLDILGISLDAFLHATDQSLELVRQQLAQTPTPYDNVVFTGNQDSLFAAFDMPGGIPYAILFDPAGRVQHRFTGRVEPDVVRAALSAGSGASAPAR